MGDLLWLSVIVAIYRTQRGRKCRQGSRSMAVVIRPFSMPASPRSYQEGSSQSRRSPSSKVAATRRHPSQPEDADRFWSDLHGVEEVLVGLVLGEDFEEVFHGLGGRHVHEVSAEVSGGAELTGIEKEFFLSGAGLGDVEGGIDARVGEVSVEGELH